jgi:hypothetical protein
MTAVELDDYPQPRIGDPPNEADFPGALRPLDDQPPIVVVTLPVLSGKGAASFAA